MSTLKLHTSLSRSLGSILGGRCRYVVIPGTAECPGTMPENPEHLLENPEHPGTPPRKPGNPGTLQKCSAKLYHHLTLINEISASCYCSRWTLAHEYFNKPNFWGRWLHLKLNISEFLESIPLKLHGDIVESWNYIMIVLYLRFALYDDILSYFS